MTEIKLSQYPVPLDVADIVTALVGMSPEVRNDVLVRAIAELGTQWLEDALDDVPMTETAEEAWYRKLGLPVPNKPSEK